MNKRKIGLLVASAMIIAVLQGCGGQAQAGGTANGAAAAAGNAAGADSTSAQQAAGNSTPGGQRAGIAAMKIGKIKSISGDKITIYESELPAGRPGGQDGATGQGSGPANGQATGQGNGQGRSGNWTPPSGAPEGGYGRAGANGSSRPAGSRGGNGQTGGNAASGTGQAENRQRFEPTFSQDTTDITVGSDTKIETVEFANGSRTETEKSIADLKAGDIITYELKDGGSEAQTIQIGIGGGLGGQRGGVGGQAGQAANGSGAEGSGK